MYGLMIEGNDILTIIFVKTHFIPIREGRGKVSQPHNPILYTRNLCMKTIHFFRIDTNREGTEEV
jgi:hypothetical protein